MSQYTPHTRIGFLPARAVFCLTAVVLLAAMSTRLPAEEPLVTSLEKVRPSVVALGVFDRVKAPRARLFATGFVIDRRGWCVTNAHVAAKLEKHDAETLRVFIPRKERPDVRKARIVITDPVHDLCIVKFQGKARAATLGDDDDARQGRAVAAYGFPLGHAFGLHGAVTHGIVSAVAPAAIPADHASQLRGKRLELLRNPFDVFHLDLRALPGNSGSPVFTVNGGKVVGIVTSVIGVKSKEGDLKMVTGITYDVPVSHIETLFEAAKKVDAK